MKFIRRVNEYFFPLEEGESLMFSDGLWFYGILVLIIVVGVIVFMI